MIFSNIWWNDTLWQPVPYAKACFGPVFFRLYVEKESSQQSCHFVLWACFVQSFLWLESWENILSKQLNLWLMKNVKNENVPALSLKLFLSKSKLYLKKSSKTRKMKNCICIQFNTWSKYLLKSLIVKLHENKSLLEPDNNEANLKALLYCFIICPGSGDTMSFG